MSEKEKENKKFKYAKWIGGTLGWALGGPIGAILGFAVGSMVDNTTIGVQSFGAGNANSNFRYRTTRNDFEVSLVILSAAMMKADGKVMRSELEYVRQFFERQFGKRHAEEQMFLLRDILKKPINVQEVCAQIRYNMQHPLRLQLLHYVFGIAQADGSVHGTEVKLIENIAHHLGISRADFESIRAMFKQDAESAYKILEISADASESEIKKAYRKMAVKYHPDKVSELGAEVRKAAEEKFIKVQEAYETIKKERNIK